MHGVLAYPGARRTGRACARGRAVNGRNLSQLAKTSKGPTTLGPFDVDRLMIAGPLQPQLDAHNRRQVRYGGWAEPAAAPANSLGLRLAGSDARGRG